MHTFLEIIDNLQVRKRSITITFPVFKMTIFSTVDFLGLIMWNLFNITMASNACDVPVNGLIKKVDINKEIAQFPLLIVGTQSLILVAKKAILKIPGKERRAEQTLKHTTEDGKEENLSDRDYFSFYTW